MRTFEKKNIGLFGVFGALIVASIIAVTLLVTNLVSNKNDTFDVLSGSLIFDSKDSISALEEDTKIKAYWDKHYYLINESSSNIDLGEQISVFDGSSLNIYGGAYRIYPDGTTEKYNDTLSISNFTESALYKLGDRRYLLVGNEVYSFTGKFSSKNFMFIKIDKNGNALLQSQGLSSKTINPILLVSGDLYFDVAAELLYSNGVEVNLRKVIGSTNEYTGAPIVYDLTGAERPATATSNEKIPDIEEYNITGGAGGIGGSAGNGGHGGNAGSGGPGGLGGTGGDAAQTRDTDYFFIKFDSYETDISSITVNYTCYDPDNAIGKIMFYVKDTTNPDSDKNTSAYLLNKYDSSYTVQKLSANTEYEVRLTYIPYTIQETNRTYVTDPANEKQVSTSLLKTGLSEASITTALMSTTYYEDISTTPKTSYNYVSAITINVSLLGQPIYTSAIGENPNTYFYITKVYKDDRPNERVKVDGIDKKFACTSQVLDPIGEDFTIYLDREDSLNIKSIRIDEIIAKPKVASLGESISIAVSYEQVLPEPVIS